MCGIIGSLSVGKKGLNREAVDIQRNMLFMSMLRGVDATGVAVGSLTDIDRVKVEKSTLTACDMFPRSKFNSLTLGARWMIGHTRASTMGHGDPEAVHPFAEGDLVGVHNGTVLGTTLLFDGIDGANDSQRIYRALAAVPPDKATSIISILEEGAYALVWYDKRIGALRFARNGDRPLWFFKHGTTWMWASEPGIIAASIAREQSNVLSYKDILPWQINTHVLLTVPLDGSPAIYENYCPIIPRRPQQTVRPQSGMARQTYSSVPRGAYAPHSYGSIDNDAYERWWEESLNDWSAGRDIYDDSHRHDSHPRGNTKERRTSVRETGWITVNSVDDVWNSPNWAQRYRVNIYRKLRWLFNIPKGQPGMGSDVEKFDNTLKDLAAEWGNMDGSKAVGFSAQYIDLSDNMMYGAITIDDNRVVPVHGFISNNLANAIKKSRQECQVDDAVDCALIQGDIKAVKVYCNGDVGLELDELELIGWEPRGVITEKEEMAGSYMTHPLRSLLAYPSMIDWSSWTTSQRNEI